MKPILSIPLLIGFFVVYLSVIPWIRRAKRVGLVGKDMHKKDGKEIAEAGGVVALIGFVLGTLAYIYLTTFYFKSTHNLIEIFSLLTSILIVGFVGFADDILGWKIGLNRNTRLFFLLFASIPLMAINAGESTMMGINFGLFYPLVLIPLGIIGATATFNFLAGYNGLEASQGILVLSALALVTWFTENSWLGMVCAIMVVCLIGFYIFNKYPARVFPGDVLTYPIGALIAGVAIIGNVEKIAIFFFIPYIIETVLKVRGNLKKQSFGKINRNGGMEVPYDKFYGLEHIAIYVLKKIKKGKEVREKDVVYLINLFQVVVIAIGLVLFRKTIFI